MVVLSLTKGRQELSCDSYATWDSGAKELRLLINERPDRSHQEGWCYLTSPRPQNRTPYDARTPCTEQGPLQIRSCLWSVWSADFQRSTRSDRGRKGRICK